MSIKSIRMKYRQKAMLDRRDQIRSIAMRINHLLIGIAYYLEQRNHPDFRHIEEVADWIISSRDFTPGMLEQAVPRLQEILDTIISNHKDAAGWVDNLQRLIAEVQMILQIQEAQSWNDATIIRIAQNIVQNNDWDQCPILADALEDAGCTDTRLLSILRYPYPDSITKREAVREILAIH